MQLVEILNAEPYASMTDADAAQAINLATVTVMRNRRMDERDILREWGDAEAAETFLMKLEAFASSKQSKKVTRAVKWMIPSEGGVDVGEPPVVEAMSQLAAAGVITELERDTLLGFASVTIDLTSEIGCGKLHDRDVKKARAAL